MKPPARLRRRLLPKSVVMPIRRRVTSRAVAPPPVETSSVRIEDLPALGGVTDTSLFVGEHAGSGLFSAGAVRDYCIAGIHGGSGGTGIPEAPTDGQYYGRSSGAWQPVASVAALTAVVETLADLTARVATLEASLATLTTAVNALTARVVEIEGSFLRPS